MIDFHPTSLDNVIYHNIAKFHPNRLITNSVIVGYERLHKLRSQKSGKSGLVAMKLDISKTYDCVTDDGLDDGSIGFC